MLQQQQQEEKKGRQLGKGVEGLPGEEGVGGDGKQNAASDVAGTAVGAATAAAAALC